MRLSFLLPALCLTAAAAPVQVGILPAKIVPEQVATLTAEPGEISDLADETQHQERGAVLAQVNLRRTEQEREEMELKIARERITTKDELRKLEAQRSKVKFYLSLSPSERRYAADAMKEEETPPSEESLKDIEERIELLKKEAETAPRLKRNEFERVHAKNTIKMPFSGRIQYHFTRPADGAEVFDYVPIPGQHFVSVCDDSAFYITIGLSRAELTQLPPENFTVSVSLPGGRVLTGRYDHRRVEQNGNSDMLVYFFRLPQEDHETAYGMLGTAAQAKLCYDAGEDVLSLRKLDLVSRPEAAECENWEELVTRLYPEYSLLLIGEREIILTRH